MFGASALLAFIFWSNPALAQVSSAIAVETDYRLRSFSYSGGRPVGQLKLGYDHHSGLYADGSLSLVLTRDDNVRFLGGQGSIGYAKRLGENWSIDVGVAHNEFRGSYKGAPDYDYSEIYAGATRGAFSAYVFVSPNYYNPDATTIYGQVDAKLSPARNWNLVAHVGSLNYVETPEIFYLANKTFYDWRLGVQRQLGPFELHAAISGGGPGRQYYYGASHSRTAVTAGASWNF